MRGLSRRAWLLGAAALVGSSELARARARVARARATLERRALGRTGREMPLLGLGCFPLGNLASEEDAVAIVARALDDGARYLDTAPSYGDGASETRVGKAIARAVREELWIATKTLRREGDGALVELEQSLARLGTEYVDCVQVHEVHDDVESLFAKGGVLDALCSARDAKKVRAIGITGHRDPRWIAQALERFDFATALVPVNPLDTLHRSFVRDFLPVARVKGVGVAAMKIYAGGALAAPGSGVAAGELVRWALAQPGVSVAVPGADSIAHWDEARRAAAEPALDAETQADILRRAGPHRGKASEWYKDA